MRLGKLALLLTLAFPAATRAAETATEHAANLAAAQELANFPIHGNLPDYVLTPAELAKAQHLALLGDTLSVVLIVWGIVQLFLLLRLGLIARMRDAAVNTTRHLWLQAIIFTGLLVGALFLLNLPISLYGHHVAVGYGLSVQGWPGWFADKAKSIAIRWFVASLIALLLFWIIRKFPRRWWLVFWATSIPISIIAVFIVPVVIDPLYNKFEPLEQTNPALVQQLERVFTRSHVDIPPSRMFLMRASAKTTTMNAYVTGFGASKRMVVWDTTLAKMTPDEVLVTMGHETGHYVLHHIVQGVALSIAGLFVLLYLAFHFVQWTIATFGPRWRIPAQDDWGALVILLLGVTILMTLSQPIQSSISRQIEHDADVYGQEAVHGIVADPAAAARDSFQVLGEAALEEPNTSPLVEFWLYDHPSTGRRAAFAAHYNPWGPGATPKYFPQ
jgi:STE24 endopeptidase